MAGNYEKLFKLKELLWCCWDKFRDGKHLEGLDEWQIEALPDVITKLQNFSEVVNKILHWVNPLDDTQPNRLIQWYGDRRPPEETFKELRKKARKTELALQEI